MADMFIRSETVSGMADSIRKITNTSGKVNFDKFSKGEYEEKLYDGKHTVRGTPIDVVPGEVIEEYDGRCIVTGTPIEEGGNLTINGIVREYEVNAGASVSAGDFVEFVNKCGAGEFHLGTTSCLSACKLDNNRVLVAYADGGNSYYGTAVVLSVESGAVSVGTECVFNSYATEYISVCTLTKNKALVAYANDNDIDADCPSENKVVVLTIQDAIISKGEVNYDVGSYVVYSNALVALTENKVLHIYSDYRNGYRSNARVITIEGTTVTGADNYVAWGGSYLSSLKASKLTESKVIAVYISRLDDNITIQLNSVMFAVDGTTISVGSYVVLASIETNLTFFNYYHSICTLTENKALVVYRDFEAADYDYANAVVLTINGMLINKGTPKEFRSKKTIWSSVAALSETKALVSYDGSAQVLTINGTTISAGEEVIFHSGATEGSSEGTYKRVIPFSDNSALVVYVGGNLGMYSSLSIDGDKITVNEIPNNGTKVQKATSNLHNVGVAKTSGEEGETVEVYCAV